MNKKEMQEMLNENLTKIKEEIKLVFEMEFSKITKEMGELKNSIQFLSDKYDDLILEKNALKVEVNSIKNLVNEQSLQLKNNKLDNQRIEMKVNDLENLSRLSNVEIQGVPIQQNENLDRMVMSLLKISDPTITTQDIKESFRLKKNFTDDAQRNKGTPILVKFNSPNKRLDVLKNRRKLAGYNFNDIGVDTHRVFINENLTAYTKSLFYQANVLKKSHEWKYIWTRNGNIKLRKNDGFPVISIRDINDLKKISSTIQPTN